MPRRVSRHSNLSNPDGDPAQAPIEVSCTVHFDQYQAAFPKRKLQDWLASLPEEAKVEFTGVRSGKTHFTAKWSELREPQSSAPQPPP